MSPHDLEAVSDFFARFAQAEADNWAAMLREDVDWFTCVQQARNHLPFLHPDIPRSEHSLIVADGERPMDDGDGEGRAWFVKTRAKEVAPRSIYAVVAANIGKEPVALVWTNGFEGRDRKKVSRMVVGVVDGELKITTRQVRCVECHMNLRLGKTAQLGCGQCGRQGWRHAAGIKIRKPEPTGGLLKNEKPPGSWDAYWNLLG